MAVRLHVERLQARRLGGTGTGEQTQPFPAQSTHSFDEDGACEQLLLPDRPRIASKLDRDGRPGRRAPTGHGGKARGHKGILGSERSIGKLIRRHLSRHFGRIRLDVQKA